MQEGTFNPASFQSWIGRSYSESLGREVTGDSVLIRCEIPSQDDLEWFSRRELPRNFRGDCDLAIRSNRALELDCLHTRIPQFIIAPGPAREPDQGSGAGQGP